MMISNLEILVSPGEEKLHALTITQKKTNSIPAKDSNKAPAVLHGLRIWLSKPANGWET